MNKFNYFMVAATTPLILLAGCGPSIKDAQRRAQAEQERHSAEVAEVVAVKHANDAHTAKTEGGHDGNNTNNHLGNAAQTSSTVSSDAPEKSHGAMAEGHESDAESDKTPIASMDGHQPDQVDQDPQTMAADPSQASTSPEADLSNAQLLAKIELLQERLQKADALKSTVSSDLSKIDRLLTENESEISTLQSALNTIEQSVDQLDHEISDISQSTEAVASTSAEVENAEVISTGSTFSTTMNDHAGHAVDGESVTQQPAATSSHTASSH